MSDRFHWKSQIAGARKKAHKAFDRLWKSGLMSRGDAYRWLAKNLNKDGENSHIRCLSVEECEYLIWLVEKCFGDLKDEPGPHSPIPVGTISAPE